MLRLEWRERLSGADEVLDGVIILEGDSNVYTVDLVETLRLRHSVFE